MVSYDITSNVLSTIWLIGDVSSDIETGVEHWNKKHYLWALASWLFMFVPVKISFVMEIVLHRCKWSKEKLWKVLGHLPLWSPTYSLVATQPPSWGVSSLLVEAKIEADIS